MKRFMIHFSWTPAWSRQSKCILTFQSINKNKNAVWEAVLESDSLVVMTQILAAIQLSHKEDSDMTWYEVHVY